jgi:hypothetical protein
MSTEGDSTAGRPPVTTEWRSATDALRLVFSRRLMCRTLVIALVVGTILSIVNQAHIIAAGDADAATWARVAANYLTPFIVSSIGALSATHR